MIFKRWRLTTMSDGVAADKMIKTATNYGLRALYKIGVYGQERQHEIFTYGTYFQYRRFIKELEPKG